MKQQRWAPLGGQPVDHDALHEGIPPWLQRPFWGWVESHACMSGISTIHPDIELFQLFDTATRQTNPVTPNIQTAGFLHMQTAWTTELALQFADFLLWQREPNAWVDPPQELETILATAGSAWTVGTRNGFCGLERRVPVGVQEAAEAAMATPGLAGEILSEAWHAVFGRDPQPDLAYRKSIEAVEASVIPVVMPNDATATLGKAIGQMRAAGDWYLPLVKEHIENPSGGVVINMMQALWSGHSDRHPGTTSYVPSTQAPAEVAVLLAVPLVQWFSSGAVVRR